MRFNVNINQEQCKKHGLNLSEAAIMDLFNQLSSWADEQLIDGKTYYHISRNKVIEELPMFFTKPDTVYRKFKSLTDKKLVDYLKLDGKDFVRLTTKGKTWNKLGFKSENTPNSDLNPSKLGNESELLNKGETPANPEKLPSDSDSNPTYNNNYTRDNSLIEIFEQIKSENPILYSGIFDNESFHQRIMISLKSEKITSNFEKDILPVLQHWIKNKWMANDFNRPVNRMMSEASSYVISVVKNGGLKEASEKQGDEKRPYRQKITDILKANQ